MRKQITRRTILKGIGAGAFSLTVAGQATAGKDTRYIVLVTAPGVKDRIERAGFAIQHALADGRVLLVVGSPDDRDDLKDVRGVQEVARDVKLQLEEPVDKSSLESTDEELFPLQWDKHDITTAAASAHDTATGSGTQLAIIDTGIEFNHQDLKPNTNADVGRLFRLGDVRKGAGSVELPKDWLDLSKGTETVTRHVANDVYGHGTHVAGIAAASNEGTTGMIGTAPDAELVPLRPLWWTEDTDGNALMVGSLGDILAAIDYASKIGADAMNMSLSTAPLPPQLNASGIRAAWERVIQRATQGGTVVVVSAGNEGTSLQDGRFQLPTAMAGSMAISATGPNDKLAFYSNFGTNEIDVGAPGGGYETEEKTFTTESEGDEDNEDEEDVPGVEWPFPRNWVLSARDPDTFLGQIVPFGNEKYLYLLGTSMAAPQVTGTVGLIREIAPNANAKKVEKAIEEGAELVEGQNAELGAGRLNCAKTLDASVLKG